VVIEVTGKVMAALAVTARTAVGFRFLQGIAFKISEGF
jgi:hypothetical protein